MPTIRCATPADLKKAQYICIETAAPVLKKNEKIRTITAALFADYYILKESRNCFVLEDNGEVVGYILSCVDLKGFCKAYRGDIFKRVCSLSPLWGFVCLFIPVKYMLWKKRYPAHLHIDILPDYQAAGYGSQLMHTLLSHLQANRLKGVMLSCGASNTRAIGFYKKHGFHTIVKAFGSQLMGLEFSEEKF